jgi:hypothetical protein
VKVRTDLVATAGLDSVALSATSLNNRVSAFSGKSKTAEGIYLEQVGTLLGIPCKIILSASCPHHFAHEVAIETRIDMYNPHRKIPHQIIPSSASTLS